MPGIAKKGSGNFTLSRQVGGDPNSIMAQKPGPGEPADSKRIAEKGSGNITVNRAVTKPPTRGPAK